MAGQCPVRHDLNMFDSAFVADPYATCPAMQESPVFWSSDLECYVVTRYDEVQAVLTDHARFSNAATNVPVTPINPEAQRVLDEAEVWFRPNLTNADAPRHTMVRRWVADAMRPRRIRALEPGVRAWAAARVEEMVTLGTADVYEHLCFPLPAITGFTLIGFPEADVEQLKSWCDRRVVLTYGRAAGAEQVEVAENVAAFWRYTNEFVKSRLEEPKDDLTSDLIEHHLEEPEEFSLRDVAAVLFGLSIAAHETTTNLMTNGIRQLLTHREQWEALMADPSLIGNAIEECLRFDGPVIGWRRRATEDVEVAGTVIPQDSVVLMLLYSANHDPRRFDGAEAFDITRPDARSHLTFGKGTHFCSGAPMARMEMRVVLENLIEKAPGMRLVEDQVLDFVPNISQRGPRGLLVDFAPDRAPALA
ncbi:MAG: cytochrome [Marmoricola sp.]|jgi:cytochrome P450|nr:cytochrome [Marmoricola sp.]